MNVLALLTAYIFSYFVGQSDGLHLAYSYDGYTWKALANNSSLLAPEIGKDRLMRDPSICQGPDGTFHMVWTSSWTDQIIGYASSKDLIHWSEQKAIPVMMHEPTAENCWAPELYYDSKTRLFYIYWATTIPGRHKHVETSESEKGKNHRIYYTTTKDFVKFSPTKMFFDPDFSVIDAAIVRDPKTKEYIMVVKNENSAPAEKNLRVTRTRSLRKDFPTEVSEPIHEPFWAEGPSPLYLEDGSLIVYFDMYINHKYGAVISKDHGKTWSAVPEEKLSLPQGIRHGTAFQVEDSVLEKLIEHYSTAAPKPLYSDPKNDAPTDPIIVQNRENGLWYMFYTSRRGNLKDGKGVEWVHGSPIGIAVSKDLANWEYLQDAKIDYAPDGDPTYWAPGIVDDGKEYHMYLTYVPGVFSDWNHPRHIVHLTSKDLLNWEFQSKLKLISEKVIDADVMQMPDGSWRMWYNQEPGGKLIAWAESKDLYNWTDHGLVEGIGNCEGPAAFRWKGSYWLICDEWKGFAVYRSDDAVNWVRQPGNIVQEPGRYPGDRTIGNHGDVVVKGDRAYLYYFSHASREEIQRGVNPRRTVIQVVELKCEDGKTISCDRNDLVVIR